MTAKDLKNALLQEAVQGKLVPQIASEGNAKDLLEQIRKEKAKLVKEGKLKKEKPLPEITEEDIPFDIPENWCWCRLGEIFETTSGTTPQSKNPIYYNNGTIGWVRTTDLNNGILSSAEIKITEKAKSDCNQVFLVFIKVSISTRPGKRKYKRGRKQKLGDGCYCKYCTCITTTCRTKTHSHRNRKTFTFM